MTIKVALEFDEVCNSWSICCPNLHGLVSCGNTESEAAANFREAAALFFAAGEAKLRETLQFANCRIAP